MLNRRPVGDRYVERFPDLLTGKFVANLACSSILPFCGIVKVPLVFMA